uniref:Protein arginine N-methyltransferase n=1 Tax=Lepeophtheirus salmonis TaxID=72036 RepID=A0A0K2T510_LEPSM
MSTAKIGSTFIQTFNAMKGKLDWQIKPKDYDYCREVARSAYADMLHDYERNRLYYVGLRAAIKQKREEGEEVHVLDIGTGTGLLSMMAAEIGADSITAVEEFNPIANVAQDVIASNGFSDKIKLIRKRSTDVEVGSGKDMERRANILVTEVFDTELIGEGAIGVFNHAHKELLTDDCLVVPCECTMYAQVVESNLASKWNNLHPIITKHGNIEPPQEKESGTSSALALHDVQLTQVKSEWFKPITNPVPIFKFDFETPNKPIPLNNQVNLTSKVINSGSCNAIFVWWDAFMDPAKKVLLSCAPIWAHPDKNITKENIPWRNHWMQAIYYPTKNLDVKVNEDLTIIGNHNEYSLMFDLSTKKPQEITPIESVVPFGGIHLAGISRTRLGQMNNEKRNASFIRALELFQSKMKEPFNILSLSDLTLLPLIAAATTSASKIYISKQNKYMETLLHDYIKSNKTLTNSKMVFLDQSNEDLQLENIPDKIDLIIGEPYFTSCYLPWYNLFYWYKVHELIKNAPQSVHVMPQKMEIWAIPVEYQDLWKIRSPLVEVEGFNVKHFDDIIMKSCDIGDADVEPQPLWEYPCIAKSEKPVKLISFHLKESIENKTSMVSIPARGKINGMALWANWFLTEEVIDSCGPVQSSIIKHGEFIDWDVHSKQGVYLFKNTSTEDSNSINIECTTSFDASEGDVKFSFSLNVML